MRPLLLGFLGGVLAIVVVLVGLQLADAGRAATPTAPAYTAPRYEPPDWQPAYEPPADRNRERREREADLERERRERVVQDELRRQCLDSGGYSWSATWGCRR